MISKAGTQCNELAPLFHEKQNLGRRGRGMENKGSLAKASKRKARTGSGCGDGDGFLSCAYWDTKAHGLPGHSGQSMWDCAAASVLLLFS